MQQRTVGINVQDSLAVGHIQITLTHWTDALEPEVSAGSVLEIAGSTFYALANDDLDGADAWGGIANSTLVYIYYAVSGTTATGKLSTTAPTWSVTKQGWYNVAETERCIGSIYKDAGGTYTQKTLFLSREHAITYQGVNLGGNSANADKIIRFDTQGGLTWDTSENGFADLRSFKSLAGAADVQIKQYTSVGAGNDASFVLKKPITCLIATNIAAPQYAQVNAQYSGGFINVATLTSTAMGIICLNPGTYRISHTAAGVTTLWAIGVYGDTAVTAANIVT